MKQRFNSFRECLDDIKFRKGFFEFLKHKEIVTSYNTVRGWHARNSIPSLYWEHLNTYSKQKGEEVTIDHMLQFQVTSMQNNNVMHGSE